MRKIVFINITLFVTIVSCHTTTQSDNSITNELQKSNPLKKEIVKQSDYNHKVMFSPESGWGYQIFKQGKLYINQPNIPAVPGLKGFNTEDEAHKVAGYIIDKLNNGIFPPTITVEELDSMGIQF